MDPELTHATIADRERYLSEPNERYRREWEAARHVDALEQRVSRARRRLGAQRAAMERS